MLASPESVYRRVRDIAALAHLGSTHCSQAAHPSNDPGRGHSWPSAEALPLETHLAAVIETALSTCLNALDDEEKATAKLYVQKAAQAAEEAWQQIVGGLQGPMASQTRQYQP